jgi:osmotically-inducible protein OsmY
VQQSTVTLSGTVASVHERQLCISCCQHVAGVTRIVDNLTVE